MSKNNYLGWFENLKCFLKDTSSNIISSLITSLVITSFVGKSVIEKTEKINISLIVTIATIFIATSVMIFIFLRMVKRRKYKPIKAIVFDFDGTLSKLKIPDIHSPWELIWKKSGYDINECHELYKRYSNEEGKHQEWCNKSCERFIKGRFDKKGLREVADNFELIPDVKDVLDKLKEDGLKLYLVSGSIKQLIEQIWGNDLDNYFDRVTANIFRFEGEKLTKIVGTKYDFEGKAKFIKEVYKQESFKNIREILFIGNSDNDQSAYKSGAQTLCVNPLEADHNNKTIWHDSIKIVNYTQLYNFIKKEYL
jgi:phosphoserine phosphatase